MRVLCNESTLLVCQLLLFTLTFNPFKVRSKDTRKLLFSRDVTSLLLTWSIHKSHIPCSVVCGFILSYFKSLGSLCLAAQFGTYSFIFRHVGLSKNYVNIICIYYMNKYHL